jgi:D-glycero-alpha-D-manno-heptose-7-phosphate kinase
MIISKTPLRMSFLGGGSDLPAYYREAPGAVISTAIDRHIFVTVSRKFDSGVRVAYSRTEEVDSSHQVEHPLVRAALARLSIPGGVEITTVADIPATGTGLGSSSSFTVGLLNALNAYQGRFASQEYLAREASDLEINVCGEPIGKQDQYAAAYGGFNLLEFLGDESVRITPVICRRSTMKNIEDHLLVLYTGITRSASALLRQQGSEVTASAEKRASLRRMVDLTYQLKREVEANNWLAFGEMLHENWTLKKSLTAGVSSQAIDDWYDAGRAAGALGGKILGAGAGGFLLFFAPPRCHDAIAHRLSHLRRCRFGFEAMGSQIIFYTQAGNEEEP